MSNTKAFNRVVELAPTTTGAFTSDSFAVSGNSFSIQLVHGAGGGASTAKLQVSHDRVNWDDEPSSETTLPATADSFTWRVDGRSFPSPFVRLVVTGDNADQTAKIFVRDPRR